MTPSPQQQAVINWVRDGKGSAFVEAVAGAGKTTTLINALAETKGFVDFAAYNTKIAQEIKAKVGKLGLGNRIHVGTFHSFGFGAWRKSYPNVKAGTEASKEKRDMTIAKFRSIQSPEALDAFTLKLVSLAKQRAIGLFGQIEDRKLWWDIIEHFDLAYELDDELDKNNVSLAEKGIDQAMRTLRWHQSISPKIIDFDDMCYMPAVSGVRMFQADWIFVDEAQDTNPVRRALARKMLKPAGRACFVGDTNQAIYGFTGADSDAIQQITREFNCATIPLTITYRCPKKVVEMAHEVVSHIQAAETAPEGNVEHAELHQIAIGTVKTEDGLKLPTGVISYTLRPDDAILCRNTKPLVKLAFALIRQGVACHVEGKDIGIGLLKLVDRFKAKTITAFRDKLVDWSEKEIEKLTAKGREIQAENLRDRVDTLLVMIDAHPPAADKETLRARIAGMFTDGENEAKPTLTLSTVHRSKGREWRRVFILGYNQYMPSPFARQEWSLRQEANLKYVAVTRSQSELIFVNVPEDF